VVATRLSSPDLAVERPAPALNAQAPVSDLPERSYDLILLGVVLALLGIGTIEIFASTAASATAARRDPYFFLERQVLWLAVGGVSLWIGASIDYRRLRSWVYPMLLLSLALLAFALVFPPRNGARRWIWLGPQSFQPVEVAKIALIAYLAYSLGKKADRVKTFTVGFVPHLVVCAAMMALLLAQPDLGSSVVLGGTTLGMLFVAGARISYIVFALLAAAPVAYHLVVGTPWRMHRFLAYFNPDAYANHEAYQFVQARLAMGSGGLTGVGLGDSHQSLGYMPEAHNDFILAPIGEELGFIGVAAVLGLFAILIWRGIRAALGARDVFGGYLAFGITLMFAIQALMHAGVVLGLVPNKGITLPLVSYGGSSLVVTTFLVGLVLNVGRRPQRRIDRGELGAYAGRRKRHRVRVALTRTRTSSVPGNRR
jgi:cell division protein FtsW